MKKNFQLINGIFTGLNLILLICIICFYHLKFDTAVTGQIGDTFGGLFSPIVGLVSIYYVIKTFNEQRAQFTEEKRLLRKDSEDREKENSRLRDKEQLDRLTDINYRQIQRIDDNLRLQVFDVYRGESAEGRRGLYTLINEIKLDFNDTSIESEDDHLRTKAIKSIYDSIDRNIDPLTDYFDHLFISLAIVSKNIENANFIDSNHGKEILRMFLLNLSVSYEDSLDVLKKALALIKDEENISPNSSIGRFINLFNQVYDMSINAADSVLKK